MIDNLPGIDTSSDKKFSGSFTKLFSVIGFTLIVFSFLITLFFLQKSKLQVLDSALTSLDAIVANSKYAVEDIWLEPLMQKAKEAASNSEIVAILNSYDEAELGYQNLAYLLNPLLENADYEVLSLDYRIISSFDRTKIGSDTIILSEYSDLLNEAYRGQTQFIPPVFNRNNELEMFLLVPIFYENRVIALLSKCLDPDGELEAICYSSNVGLTGETYAIDRYGRMLTKSRYSEEYEIIDTIPYLYNPNTEIKTFTYMVEQLLTFKSGKSTIPYTDYRGVETIGSWIWLDSLNIGIATEMDIEEVLSSYHHIKRVAFILLLTAILITLTIFIAGYMLNRESILNSRMNRDFLNAITGSTVDGIVVFNNLGRILFINNTAEELLGYNRSEIIGSKFQLIAPDFTFSGSSSKVSSYDIKKYIGYGDQYEILSKNDSKLPIHLSINEMIMGHEILYAANMQDLQQRHKKNHEIMEQEKILRAMTASAFSAIIMVGYDGTISFWNDAAERIFGWSAPETLNVNIYELLKMKYEDKEVNEIDNLFVLEENITGKETVIELIAKNKLGKKIDIEISLSQFEHGDDRNLVAIINDITRRKNIEFELESKAEVLEEMNQILDNSRMAALSIMEDAEHQKSRAEKAVTDLMVEKKLSENIINSMPGIFMMINRVGYISLWNNQLEEIIGRSKEDIVTIKFSDIISRDGCKRCKEQMEALFTNERGTFEIVLNTVYGQRPYLFSGVSVNLDNVEYVLGTAVDISEQKRVEDSLRKLSYALEESPVTVVITDKQANIEYVNRKFSEISGYEKEEVIGQNPRILKSGVQEEHTYKSMWDTILAGREWHGDLCNRKKDNSLFWESVSISPIKDKDGNVSHFVAVKEEISEKKEIQRKLESQAERLQMHQHALKTLTRSEDFANTNIIRAYKIISKAASRGLMVARASLWFFIDNGEALECASCYVKNNSDQEIGQVIKKIDHPNYFHAINKQKVLNIPGAWMDEATTSLLEDYLSPKDIISILEIPIWHQGEMVGIVSFEQVGTSREWEDDEIVFGQSIADYASLAIETYDRKEAQTKAEAATVAKSDFLANMSHEIRTPMNAIIGLNNLLGKTKLNKKQNDYISKIERSSETLMGIINDILDFSKIEAGQLDIETLQYNIDDLFSNLSNVISSKAYEKGLDLIFEVPKDLPQSVVGDPLRSGQVLLNLVNNAIKFTSEGEIVVKARVAEKKESSYIIEFSVTDSGIGLDENHRKKLFKPFSQADTSTTRKYGGTGLGLSICKRLVEMMGGEIGVESIFGEGSCFFFTIDVGKVNDSERNYNCDSLKDKRALIALNNPKEADIIEKYLSIENITADIFSSRKQIKKYDLLFVDDKYFKSKKIIDLSRSNDELITIYFSNIEEDFSGADGVININEVIKKPFIPHRLFHKLLISTGQETENSQDSTNIKQDGKTLSGVDGSDVLVVEDNEINQQVIRELLVNEGIIVTIASNGKEACDLISKNSYQLVFMDLQMPEMDGFEATREIRKKHTNEKLPIIAMTADAMSGVKERTLKAGMNEYLTKPIDITKLYAMLGKYLDSKEISIKEIEEKLVIHDIDEIPDIRGINISEGLNRVAGNRKLYKSILVKFKNSNKDTISKILNEIENENFIEAESLCHAFKGVSGNIGAEEVFELSAALDMELKKPNPAKEKCLNQIKEIEPILKQILDDIEKVKLEEIDTKNEQIDIDPSIVNVLFTRIEEKLSEFDIGAETIFDELKTILVSEIFSAKINEINECLASYNFEKALEATIELRTLFHKEYS